MVNEKEKEKARLVREMALIDLQKITYKKKTPNVLVFQFNNLHQQYQVEKPHDVVMDVNERVSKL